LRIAPDINSFHISHFLQRTMVNLHQAKTCKLCQNRSQPDYGASCKGPERFRLGFREQSHYSEANCITWML